MAVHACGGDGFDRGRSDGARARLSCSLRRAATRPRRAGPGAVAIAIALWATATACAQEAFSDVGDGVTAQSVIVDGGFDAGLLDDATTARSSDGYVAGEPGSVGATPQESYATIDDGMAGPMGESVAEPWAPFDAFESFAPAPCGRCGLGKLACCLSGCCGPRWCAQVDSLVLWQGQVPSMPLLIGPTGLVALDANEAQTSATPGFRAGLVRCLSDCTSIEGNYLWARPFQSNTRVPPTAGFYSTTNLADLTFTDLVNASMQTQAQFQGAEINWRYGTGGIFTWLTGFRWVQWDQQSTIAYNYAPTGGVPGGQGSIAGQVANDLYGWQFGGLMRLWDRGGRWNVRGVGKAGVYYNQAWQQTAVFDGRIPVPPNNPVSASGSTTSFVGEVGVNSTLWITQWLAWRLGYSWFWLTDVAVPQSQFPVSSIGDQTAAVSLNDTVLVHGVTTGLEICW
jgi:hypothetical protein